jgi:caffeoyl-CoA O-methyltransferase
MFSPIPQIVLNRMKWLEETDARDRLNGTPRAVRLRQVGPETGRFLAVLASSAPAGRWVEIGTSGGYSALWLSLAAQQAGASLTTFELDPEKVALARETFRLAGVDNVIEVVQADGLEALRAVDRVSFCFLDAEKDIYTACHALAIPRMVPGGWFLADNAISHREELGEFLRTALEDPRTDATIVPVGRGVLLARVR